MNNLFLKFEVMVLQYIVVPKMKIKSKNFKDGGHDVTSKNRSRNLVAEKSQQLPYYRKLTEHEINGFWSFSR